jgi:hypothetical protein
VPLSASLLHHAHAAISFPCVHMRICLRTFKLRLAEINVKPKATGDRRASTAQGDNLAARSDRLGAVIRPRPHEAAALLQQRTTPIGGLDLVRDRVG